MQLPVSNQESLKEHQTEYCGEKLPWLTSRYTSFMVCTLFNFEKLAWIWKFHPVSFMFPMKGALKVIWYHISQINSIENLKYTLWIMCLLGTIVISELQLEIAMSLFMKMSLELNNLLLHHVSSHITLQPSTIKWSESSLNSNLHQVTQLVCSQFNFSPRPDIATNQLDQPLLWIQKTQPYWHSVFVWSQHSSQMMHDSWQS